MTTVVAMAPPRTKPLAAYWLRLCRWPPLLVGVTLAWSLTWWKAGEVGEQADAVWLIRGVLVVGVVAAVFALDDPSRDVTEATGARWVVPARLGTALAAVAASALPVALLLADQLNAAVVGGLALEAITLLALLSGAALTLQRRWGISEPAQFVGLGILAMAAAEQLRAGRWPLLTGPDQAWGDAHARWSALLVLAGLVCVWQLRDPAARPPWRRS
jgi:hypothetical protein